MNMSQRMFVLDLPVSKCKDCNKEKICKYKKSYKKNIIKDNPMRKLVKSNKNIEITIKCKYFEDKISALRRG